jgi:two-component system, OmpR family, phosphate regulon response regulator OmpR
MDRLKINYSSSSQRKCMLPITHILVVDDDTRIRDLLSRFLQDHGYFVTTAKDALEANQKLESYLFDLLIIDIMMPGETGIELTRRLRKTMTTPILMLTAMGEVEDRISGLSTGADDYLAKPFEPRELLLRIQNIINRTKPSTATSHSFQFGQFIFDLKTDQLTKDNSVIPLTSNESKLLHILCENLGLVVLRETFAEIFGGISERSIDVQITRLRNKIEENPKKPLYLKTIRSQGYILYGERQ